METNRAGIDEQISEFDLQDTYLPQYGIAFTEGKAAGVMCSCAPAASSRDPVHLSFSSVPRCSIPPLHFAHA